jgi:hypothetical protein
MAKDTFIIRTEWIEAIQELSDTDQAIIFRNLFYFHSDKEDLIILNNLSVKLVWKLIEPNLTRNIQDYDKRRETSVQNGRLGGRPTLKNLDKPKKNLNNKEVFGLKPNNPIVTVTDTVSDTVSDTVIDSDINNVVVSEKTTTTDFYNEKLEYIKMLFKRCSNFDDEVIDREARKFTVRYPELAANKSGALINTWVANYNEPKPQTRVYPKKLERVLLPNGDVYDPNLAL